MSATTTQIRSTVGMIALSVHNLNLSALSPAIPVVPVLVCVLLFKKPSPLCRGERKSLQCSSFRAGSQSLTSATSKGFGNICDKPLNPTNPTWPKPLWLQIHQNGSGAKNNLALLCPTFVKGKNCRKVGVDFRMSTPKDIRYHVSAQNGHGGRCRTVRARCARTVRARFNVFGMVAQLVPR